MNLHKFSDLKELVKLLEDAGVKDATPITGPTLKFSVRTPIGGITVVHIDVDLVAEQRKQHQYGLMNSLSQG